MRWAVTMLVVAGLFGCSNDETCVTVDPDCTPEYDPTFDKVYERTLILKCALPGGVCHAAEGNKGNLTLEGIDAAHEGLVTDGRVVPGDPSCSVLIQRLHGEGGLMPPSSPLSDTQRCAIERWVANGAER